MSLGQTKIMCVVNLSPDSFHALSIASSLDDFKRKVDGFLDAGADIIDLGACSSRPGSVIVDMEEEWRRLEPYLECVARDYAGYSFSIDTFRSSIVLMAYQTIGRFIINDISAGEWDPAMLPVAGRLGLRYVAVHHCGTFDTIHDCHRYDDVVKEVTEYFCNFKVLAEEAGISEWILDPGFGFSKSTEDNIKLLEGLQEFKKFRRPILVGLSDKRMTQGNTDEFEKKAINLGASILRTHRMPCFEL